MQGASSSRLQDLVDDAPEFRRCVGFERLGHTVLDAEGRGAGIQGISREEDEAPTQPRIASLQRSVETKPIQLRPAGRVDAACG